MDTYITLSILLIFMVWLCVKLLHALFEHDKKSYTSLNLPLENKGKWWYH